MELYRSGHNEAVLKTVCPKGTWVRIPPAPPNLSEVTPIFCTAMYNEWGYFYANNKRDQVKNRKKAS